MTSCTSNVHIKWLTGVKRIERARYDVHVERIGGAPYRYWAQPEHMRMGPFTTHDEARSWCYVLGRYWP